MLRPCLVPTSAPLATNPLLEPFSISHRVYSLVDLPKVYCSVLHHRESMDETTNSGHRLMWYQATFNVQPWLLGQ
jgi:hypothetical protein